jgi:excisionase family DNA binding protein
MNFTDSIEKPSKEEQRAALQAIEVLDASLDRIKEAFPEIEIEETGEKIRVPLKALKLLSKILKELGKGKPVSILPNATEMTTQAAAEMLGCSRPHLVNLLEQGKIPFTKVGKHRRIKLQDLNEYKRQTKLKQRQLLAEMMQDDEAAGLYDS